MQQWLYLVSGCKVRNVVLILLGVLWSIPVGLYQQRLLESVVS